MKKEIEKARDNLDSVGGVIETYVNGLKGGIGNPFFDSLESVIAHALFSIPGVKGVEFGLGFNFKDKYGSEVSDSLRINDGKVTTLSNNNGGINGGISNGMPLVLMELKSTSREEVTIEDAYKQLMNYKEVHIPTLFYYNASPAPVI